MRKVFAVFAIVIISISIKVSAKELSIEIKKGMPYIEARKILLDAGWQTVTAHTTPNGTPVCFKVQEQEDESLANSEACNYEEIDSCSGTGMGFCGMKFFDGEETYLSITTDGGEPPEAEINRWIKVKKKDFELTATQDSLSPELSKPEVSDIEPQLKEGWGMCKGLKMSGLTKTNGIDKGNSYEMGISYKLEFLRDLTADEAWQSDAGCPVGSGIYKAYWAYARMAGLYLQPVKKGDVITVNDVFTMVKSEKGWISQ